MLPNALRMVVETTGMCCGDILLWEGESQRKMAEAHHCEGEEEEMAQLGAQLLDIIPQQEVPVILQDSTTGHLTAVGIPLRARNRVIGTIRLFSREAVGLGEQNLDLLNSIGQQIGLAVENARLYEQLQEKEELRTQLLESVIAAQEEERKRIARELHDETGQSLTALIMNLEALERFLPPELVVARERLGRTKGLTSQALEEIRKMILDLRPTALDDLGLVPALRRYAETHLEPVGVKVELEASNLQERLPGHIETVVFRIIQEAINNVARHSKASRVRIFLEGKDSSILGTVEDNGAGFDAGEVLRSRDKVRGLGLAGMRERAVLSGGTCSIVSQAGVGTRVHIEIPVYGGGNSHG